ncbi:MAG: aminoacyl-tRNA hydrolase [Chloroflexi bacterium GWB2_49_20]|nr:MAG: aminoacyl-tRNA hydrolase [Chloroflexi bacterium GWB2_49_20]OGN78961.1 MAG: aminoacyl-tRNA hydrolase [Chloroflexi bacterium GWC2_49_37]OGN86278.1 MAG: aminoacyl-tRNA hydrolase [Chloroflexi bacterium GWD2_49_16]
MSETLLIVGLGNPGRVYRENRHNVGFMMIDSLAVRLKLSFSRLQFKALVTSGDYRGTKLILAKPQTYMNLSDQAVVSLLKFYKLPLNNFLVANDDLDLPVGTIRIRPSGGSAGQKGINSIIENLGTQDFPRLRLGIGRPPGQMEVADYVLQNFSNGEIGLVNEMVQRAVDAVLLFSEKGLNAAMTKYNGQISGE